MVGCSGPCKIASRSATVDDRTIKLAEYKGLLSHLPHCSSHMIMPFNFKYKYAFLSSATIHYKIRSQIRTKRNL